MQRLYRKLFSSKFRGKIRRKILRRDYSLTYEELFQKRKVIFIHIPKTAGVSISQALFNRDSAGHQKLLYFHEKFTNRRYKRCFKFTFVRNPYIRLYSAYRYLKAGGRGNVVDKNYQKIINEYNDFEDFVLNFINTKKVETIDHFIPQCDWIKNNQGEIDIDFIGKYENLIEDFAVVCGKLGVKADLPIINSSGNVKPDYSSIYNIRMKTIIDDIYKEDFSFLKYKKEVLNN